MDLNSTQSTQPPLTYHSEAANDRWIAELIFPGKRDGYFVEAGAADGIGGSSCYALEYELGWTGICIEAHDGLFTNLARTRPNSVHENACLAGQSGSVIFIEGTGDDPLLPYYSGIRKNLITKGGGIDIVSSGKLVKKQAVSLAQVLEKHGAPSVIDYGAFDIENSEADVLESFPFSRYAFRAISAECDGSAIERMTMILDRAGYHEVKNPFNLDCPWERYWLHADLMP